MLHTLAKNDLKAVQPPIVLVGRPTLYKQLPIEKRFKSDQLPPYTQGQAEGWYYLKSPDQRGQEYRGKGVDESSLEVYQAIFRPDYPKLSPIIPTNDTGKINPPAGTAPASQAPTATASP